MAETYTEAKPATKRRPPTASAEQLLKRWQRIVSKRAPAMPIWQDIADLVAPGYNFITIQANEGQKATRKIFDSTAPKANADLATNLVGAMIPTAHEWFSLRFGSEDLNAMKSATDWLEDCTKRMYQAFNSKSNFQREGKSAFKQFTTFSQMCVFLEEKEPGADGKFKGLRFKSLHAGTYGIEENADGDVDTLAYEFDLSARAAYAKWKDKCGDSIVTLMSSGGSKDQDQPFKFLHFIYPDPQSAEPQWRSCLVAIKDKKIVDEQVYPEIPFFVPRWDKRAGNVYGTDGPSELAFPAVRSLNMAKEIVLKAAPLAMQPPTFERTDAVIGDPDLVPGGRNVIDAPGAIGDSFGFMDSHAKVDVSQFVFGELRQEILEIYFVNQMRLKQSPQMTATEVLELRDQMERLLGPTAGRIEEEFLNPLIRRAFHIMLRGAAFMQAPEELVAYLLEHGMRDTDIDVQYEGPLQRVRRSDDALAMQATVQDALQWASIRPEVLDNIDWDWSLKELGKIRGTPGKMFVDEKQVQALRQARADMQQQQAQAAQMTQVAESLGKGGPGVKALAQAGQIANTSGLPANGQGVAA
jgi:hypothetical protein